MKSRAAGLFFLLLLLTAAAVAVLGSEQRRGHERRARAESFQHLVGGLGIGPSLGSGSCASDFDPRLEDSCSMDFGPIAGGGCFTARQMHSVFSYPPLQQRLFLPNQDKGDALFP